MRLIKPLRLSFIHRVFGHRKKQFMVVTVAYCFPIDAPKAPVMEPETWKMIGQELGRFGVLDHWMFKPKAEVLVTGACFTGEREKGSEFVRLAVTSNAGGAQRKIDKKLYVFGDRRWTLIGPSEPEMFSRMPIDYPHAFGGEKSKENPIGKGLAAIRDESGAEIHPLPNIEDPKSTIKSKADRPSPASFAGWDLTWPFHFEKKMGTYSADWVQKNGFALADDIDFSLFNVAAPDQRVEGHWGGDEEIHIENMHPERRVLDTKLPGFLPRAFLRMQKSVDPEQRLLEVPLQIDTIHCFPSRERVLVLARGVREITTHDGTDVELALAAMDDPDNRRPLEHFERVLALRLDKEKGALHALRDRDLMPPSATINNAAGVKIGDPLEDVPHPEGLARQHFAERARREYEHAREELRAQGIEEHLLPPPPPPPQPIEPINLEELPEAVEALLKEKDARQAEAERTRREAEEQLEAFAKENNLDLAAARQKAKSDRAGPPKFTADGELERLRDLSTLAKNAETPIPGLEERLADPNLRAQLLEVEHQLYRAYRLSAHMQEPANTMTEAESAAARSELLAIISGTPRERRDFTGVDLSGLDLTGIDLEGAFLEGANLKGTNLSRARLRDAVLARANLEGARLVGAELARANLGAARLANADLTDANLEEAILYEADASSAKFIRAKLSAANTLHVKADGADFSGATAKQLIFLKASLRGAVFRGATIRQSVFMECEAAELDASTADFSESVFLMSTGDKATFANAKVDNLRILMSSFEKSDFRNASMPGCNLRGAKLAGANLSGVNLRRSDLSTADLRGADCTRTIAVECLLMDTVLDEAKLGGANLMLAIMHRTQLRGADVSNANLFCADLTGAVGDKRTSFSGSNVKRALVAGVMHG
ncbi:MAG: DUF2169 domain-containing protein [Polyangiaceae bacterium]